MNQAIIEKVNQEIYKQFPYLKECTPKVSSVENNNFQLIYMSEAKTENGFPIPLIVRVIVNADGKVIKLSTSR